jgi:hypothetical protein
MSPGELSSAFVPLRTGADRVSAATTEPQHEQQSQLKLFQNGLIQRGADSGAASSTLVVAIWL